MSLSLDCVEIFITPLFVYPGSVYMFITFNGGTVWSPTSKLVASDRAQGDVFGRSISLYGDMLAVGIRTNGPGVNCRINISFI